MNKLNTRIIKYASKILPTLVILAFMILPFVILFHAVGVVATIIIIGIIIHAFICYGIDKKLRNMLRMVLYYLSALLFYGLSINFLNNSTLWMFVGLFIMGAIAIFFIHWKTDNDLDDSKKMYVIRNCIASGIGFGILPFVVYFIAFLPFGSDFVYERYFENVEKIHIAFDNTNILDYLDNMDRERFSFENRRIFVASVVENRDDFIQHFYSTESIVRILDGYNLTPTAIYDYFYTWNSIYTMFDSHFLMFGFGTGILFFCLYQNYANKKRKAVMKFGIFVAIIMFLSTFADGAIIFWLVNYVEIPFQASYVDINENVDSIQEMLRTLSIVFAIIFAFDRVYKIEEKK